MDFQLDFLFKLFHLRSNQRTCLVPSSPFTHAFNIEHWSRIVPRDFSKQRYFTANISHGCIFIYRWCLLVVGCTDVIFEGNRLKFGIIGWKFCKIGHKEKRKKYKLNKYIVPIDRLNGNGLSKNAKITVWFFCLLAVISFLTVSIQLI